jgi:DnaJ-class molecular chaperone
MTDYYQILEVSPEASADEIRRAYRRLALRNHPDRNPGDSSAEERFKSISEAYGVLIDLEKRRQYDQSRSWTAHSRKTEKDFGYSQEEIFRDLFRNPEASRIFQDLFREFDKAGVRFDKQFFDRVFFGGRGILFGGIFVWGPLGPLSHRVSHAKRFQRVRQVSKPGPIERFGQKIGRLLTGRQEARPQRIIGKTSRPMDLCYHLNIPVEKARQGTNVQIAIDRGKGQERLNVRIPKGTRSGTRLRLKGKGLFREGSSGDLYLTINAS